MQPLIDPAQILAHALAGWVVDLRGWALAWARVTPALTLVPAFGLTALPAQSRAALGLALAVSIAPALQPASLSAPFGVALLLEAARGLPVALSAAGALWAAGMAGGLTDNLRGARETQSLPVVDDDVSPLGALLSILVALVFLEGGGAARVVAALALSPPVSHGLLWQVAAGLTHSVELALAVASPVVAVSIVAELSNALLTRAATPAHVAALLAPLRSVVILIAFALLFERMTSLLATSALHAP
ncbi:MAG TPA: flagellar biosynthetic protein FliR [Polyangiaceae bacterium]|jgi:flagellar biosynthetic protein FliR|nr:flagellar biosynthetic protein FliR [Polyangiaceae bacterium]